MLRKKILASILLVAIILTVIAAFPMETKASGDFMTGTWSFGYLSDSKPRGDMKAYITQNGSVFEGIYNKNHYSDWQLGFLTGSIEGNKVTGKFVGHSWKYNDNSYGEELEFNFNFTYDPATGKLSGSPGHLEMTKISKEVGSPTCNNILDVKYLDGLGGQPAQPETKPQSETKPETSEDWLTGTWKELIEDPLIYKLKVAGNKVTGTYYFSNEEYAGEVSGTMESNRANLLWSVIGDEVDGKYEGKTFSGKFIIEFKEGKFYLKAYYDTGELDYTTEVVKYSGSLQEKPIQEKPVQEKPIQEKPILDTLPPGTKIDIDTTDMFPEPDNAIPVQITGGTARDTTKPFNGVTGVTVIFERTNVIGYRLYRSEIQGQLGISVTDFYITSENFTDVNVEPNTTYYYTLKEVLAEARPLEGVREREGKTLATWTVKTSGDIGKTFTPGKTRKFIMLKIDDPMMSVNGISEEVDPGRGTTPIVERSRTMVPIRAIVEAMGGTAGWNQDDFQVMLGANGNNVNMWIDKKEFKINGADSKLDVPPFLRNQRTFVPIRFSAENLNCQVDWINSTKSIVIVWEE